MSGRRARPRKIAGAGSLHVSVLAFFTVALAFPFFWMLIATFKQNIDLYTVENNPFLFNLPPTLDHVRFLFEQTRFLRWLGNTALVGGVVVVITLLVAVPAAYALARLTGRWGERLGIAIFLTYLIPPTLLFIPLSRVVAILGLQDSIFSRRPGLPEHDDSLLDLAPDGVLQVHPEGARGRGDGGRPDALRRLSQDGRADLRVRDPDRRHLQLHPRDPGVRLRADLHLARRPTRWSAWASRSSSCAATCTTGARSWPPAWSRACRSAFIYNLFLDRFIAGFTVVGQVAGKTLLDIHRRKE